MTATSTEYTVLIARDVKELEHLVREAMTQGLEPIGGVSIQKMRDARSENDDRNVMFAQAVGARWNDT